MNEIIALENNKYIRVREQNKYNLESINFTKKAFFKAVWNEFTIKARGLFVDKDTKEIKLRSYNKFFNYNENSYANDEYIFNNVVYPVTFYKKYNGFLGMMSVIDNDIVLATKSMVSGDFVELFNESFYSSLSHKQITLLKIIASHGYTCVFEVLNVEDKHIIDFDKNEVILLDILPNKLNLEYNDYAVSNMLLCGCRMAGIKVKEIICTCKNKEELEEAINKMHNSYDSTLEGVVVADSNGYMFKIKTRYYTELKNYRKAIEYAKKYGIDKANEKYNLDIKSEYLKCENIIEVQKKYGIV